MENRTEMEWNNFRKCVLNGIKVEVACNGIGREMENSTCETLSVKYHDFSFNSLK